MFPCLSDESSWSELQLSVAELVQQLHTHINSVELDKLWARPETIPVGDSSVGQWLQAGDVGILK